MRTWLTLLLFAAAAWPQDGAGEAPRPELHKIYVPYDQLDEVLGTEKERVMVPYREFLELWKLKYGRKPSPDAAPLPWVVEAAAYEGRVEEGVAAFRATIAIEVLEEGWQKIPLAFTRIAFEEITVDGEGAVLASAEGGYELLLKGKGRHEVRARFVAGIERGKEYATCAFGLPEVPLHRLTFRVPGRGTEVRLEPARAHTTTTEGDETVLLAFLGAQPSVKLTWRFRPEEAEREPPLVFSEDLIDVRVEERVLRGHVRFRLQVLRTPTDEVRVLVPAGAQVLEVQGPRIRTWTFADEARRELRVVLHEPVEGAYELQVGYEMPVEVPGAIDVPVFRVEDATRERGFLRISSAEAVGLRPTTLENVFQTDLATLPEEIRGGERALGFRFPALPYALGLRTERIQPLVTLVHRARFEVERRTTRLDAALHFTVERAGLFDLAIEVPPGIVLTDIGDPKLVDTWRETEEDGVRVLRIDLRGRRIGAFQLPIRAVAPLDLAAEDPLEVPLLKVRGVDREEGTLGVFMDPGIKAVAETGNVVPLEPDRLQREDGFSSSLPLAFAWRWRGRDPSVSFDVEARKPKVTCDVRYDLVAEEARVRVRAALAYDVEYSGVETFRFRVPKRITDLNVDARNLREKRSEDDPVEEGKEPTVTWTVTLQGPALGPVVVEAQYDDVFAEPLAVNATRTVAIPALVPLDVERASAFVAVRKSPALKVEATGTAYEQIDAAELPEELRSDDVLLALRRFEAPEPFPLELTKHEYQPVADLVVRHAHLKTVLADESRATTLVFLEVLNNDRQFLALKLPENSQVKELLVMGRPEKPRLGKDGVLLVRLETGLRKDAYFEVDVAYTHPVRTEGGLGRATHLEGPVLPGYEESAQPFQALLSWEVHYPDDWHLTGTDGNVRPVEAEPGSWLRRAIGALGSLLRPTPPPPGEGRAGPVPLDRFADFFPAPTQAHVSRTFLNGTGDARLVLSHVSETARVVFVVLAVVAGIAAVWGLSRAFRPLRAGGAVALLAAVLLAFSGPGWAAFWNGLLVAALATGLVVALLERRKVRA